MATAKKSAATAAAAESTYLGARISPHYCTLRVRAPAVMPPGVADKRARLIATTASK